MAKPAWRPYLTRLQPQHLGLLGRQCQEQIGQLLRLGHRRQVQVQLVGGLLLLHRQDQRVLVAELPRRVDIDEIVAELQVEDLLRPALEVPGALDGEEFLELLRVSPALAGFISKKWYARGAYVYSDKSITQRPERDAETHAGEGDLYFFRRGLRSYFNFGYKYKDEDAVAARLDYTSHSFKLRYIHRLEVLSRITKLELAWRYEDRDYSSITPSIGEERRDKRNRWRADYEIPVWRAGAVQIYYSYADYDSNYEPVDYNQTIAGARFVYRW